MEKLNRVTRLRLTEMMYLDIRRFAELDDRKYLEDAMRHLLRVGLEAKQGYGPIFLREQMAEEIQKLAEVEERTYLGEIHYLLRLALEQKRKQKR